MKPSAGPCLPASPSFPVERVLTRSYKGRETHPMGSGKSEVTPGSPGGVSRQRGVQHFCLRPRTPQKKRPRAVRLRGRSREAGAELGPTGPPLPARMRSHRSHARLRSRAPLRAECYMWEAVSVTKTQQALRDRQCSDEKKFRNQDGTEKPGGNDELESSTHRPRHPACPLGWPNSFWGEGYRWGDAGFSSSTFPWDPGLL